MFSFKNRYELTKGQVDLTRFDVYGGGGELTKGQVDLTRFDVYGGGGGGRVAGVRVDVNREVKFL